MESKYVIDPVKNELKEYYEGDITLEDISNILEAQFSDENFKPGIRATVDMRKARILFHPKDCEVIEDLFNRNLQKVKTGKWAFVVATYYQAALAVQFEKSAIDLPVFVKFFTSSEDANEWLNT